MTPSKSITTTAWRRAFRRDAMTAGILLAAAMHLAASTVSAQTDQIYFPAVDNVTSILVSKINAETVRVDMSAWYLSEHAISFALINARNRGVQVRLIGDRGSIFEIDANTRNEFYWLASQGVPIRLRYNPNWFPEIDHMKMTIFKGQGLVSFGSANYTPFELAPFSSTDHCDETVMFSTDPALVGAFLTRFDQIWNDTTAESQSILSSPPYLLNWNSACAREAACADYATLYPNPAPMSINTSRLEPNNPMPADLIWGQGAQFNNRLVQEINNESSAIKFVIYRLTVDNITNALLGRFQAGVPTQLIIEPSEYMNRKWPEFWLTHANIDKLWAAGIPIRQRQHAGMTHMKMLVTSSYATNASSNYAANWQRDNDYFVSAASKPGVYSAMRNRFDAMWNDGAGFADFAPQPPDRPVLTSPALGATGVSQTARLTWNAAPFATNYDVYIGTSSSNMVFVANVPAQLVQNPPSTYSWTAGSPLTAGSKFYWRVVARTNATARDSSLVTSSAVWSFVTGSGQGGGSGPTPAPNPPPAPPPPAPEPAPAPAPPSGSPARVLSAGDLAVWRPSTGVWWALPASTGYTATDWFTVQWGLPGDIPVSADYDGDGKKDIAVWRPANGLWYVLTSSSGYASGFTVRWGLPGDVPVPGDYDGDGKTDIAVWRPGTGVWYVLTSSSGYATWITVQWGLPRDVPVPADYDGDGKTDIAVWRPSSGVWYILTSASAYSTGFNVQWGLSGLGDVPVPADYDGDGRADIAIWRPGGGTWYVLKSTTNFAVWSAWSWGLPGDVPVPADYDRDGRADLAIWRPSTGTWWVLTSGAGYATGFTKQWGIAGDVPLK